MEIVQFLADTCYGELAPIYAIINKVLGIIRILVPILLILWGTMDLLKAVIASKDEDMKKAWQTLLKRALYAILIFLLTNIVMFALNGLGNAGAVNCLK